MSTILCPFCRFSPPYFLTPAIYVIDGIGVCEEHVDAVSGQGFGKDLYDHQQEEGK
jgi:hypothetical protein